MPERPVTRLPLRVLPGHSGGSRDAMTCAFRCGNACAHPIPNQSANPTLGEVVQGGLSRRGLLTSGAAAAVALTVAPTVFPGSAAAAVGDTAAPAVPLAGPGAAAPGSALTFSVIPPNRLDTVVVPNGYDWSPLISWGDPVEPGAPAFDIDKQSPAAQARQFGYNNDYVGVLPLGKDRALLVVNHEYTNEILMFRGWDAKAGSNRQQALIAMAAHGMSVVEIERVGRTGEWRVVSRGRRPYNRRVTATTPFRLTGPAAGSEYLRTSADPRGTTVLGTLNNCAGGLTPWGTVLSGEENFNQYFGSSADITDPDVAKPLARYGVTTKTSSTDRRWEQYDKRFDVAREPNEPNRHGWIVEIDPYDPKSTPRKLTALGRFKHEGANIRLAEDGRAVAYMGDDERHDYLYKFVSRRTFRPGPSAAARRHNLRLLDEGDLYVAQLTGDSPGEIDGTGKLPSDGAFDGTGRWLPLVKDGRSRIPGWSVARVLVHTRLAADELGRLNPADAPTKMDRPEDVEPNPRTGKVYAALTNNTDRGKTAGPTNRFAPADEANPRNGNKHGQVLELTEARNDAAATTFTWRLFIVAGDPASADTYFGGYDKSKVSPISCPDNVAFDPAGNLWIATDGNALESNDGLFAVPLDGPEAGHVKQFLTVPKGAETCGPFITPDARTVFAAVQHPGELTGATVDNPLSTFPHGQFPQPSVITVWRKSAGSPRIGT